MSEKQRNIKAAERVGAVGFHYRHAALHTVVVRVGLDHAHQCRIAGLLCE